MIRINLVKNKKAGGSGGKSKSFDFKTIDFKNIRLNQLFPEGKKFDIHGPLPKAIIGLALVWLIDDTLGNYRKDHLEGVTKEIVEIDKQRTVVNGKLAKIKGFEPIKKQLEEDETAIRTKLEVINRLLENRNAPSKMMIQIAQSIPDDVWLTSLSVNEEKVKLAGATPAYNQVSDFIKALNGTSQFGEIALSGIQESTSLTKDQKFQAFELHASRRNN